MKLQGQSGLVLASIICLCLYFGSDGIRRALPAHKSIYHPQNESPPFMAQLNRSKRYNVTLVFPRQHRSSSHRPITYYTIA